MSTEAAITTNSGQEKRQTKRQRKAEAFRKGDGRKKSRNDLGEPVSTTLDEDEVVAPDLKQLVADSGDIFKLDGAANTDTSRDNNKRAKGTAKSKSKVKNKEGAVASTAVKIATPIATPTTATAAAATATKSNNNSSNNDSDKKRRYIVFVGRLAHSTTKDEIKQHFESAGGIADIRLLTEKGTNAPRGCGFVEFDNANSLKVALGLHESKLKGRKISVELTVGGGGKSENRANRLRNKNEKLRNQQRQPSRNNKR
ncbi:hypothetical protein BDF22DRAFT_774719 [Syncephalis plumigaleata]|nr:hypothetical protein BDF22DRAFT_774719 [Syncephalis plumigaleata]